jgi:hypothetical protein
LSPIFTEFWRRLHQTRRLRHFDDEIARAKRRQDWNHISPYGGRDQGREATMTDVRSVHQSFLKGTTDTVGKWTFGSPVGTLRLQL